MLTDRNGHILREHSSIELPAPKPTESKQVMDAQKEESDLEGAGITQLSKELETIVLNNSKSNDTLLSIL